MEALTLTVGDSIDKLFYSFDYAIFSFFGSIQNTVFNYIAKFFTTFGDENFVIPMAVLGVILMCFKKTRKFGFALTFSIVIGTLITNVAVKPLVLRIRPYNTLQADAAYMGWYTFAGALSESDYSFPSGHTTAAFEMAVSMFLVFKNEHKKKIAWVFPVIAVFTMCSRVYLMVHYATDVLAGMVVGTVAGIAGYFLMKLCIKLISDVKPFTYLDRVDLGKIIKIKSDKIDSSKIGAALVGIFVAVFFVITFVSSASEGGDSAIRCAYNGDYDCYNEAKVDDEDYPAIDGEYYCKIHWKELMGVE
ncbi:MAG: phosphatase PAP2 family protein [Clostridiales bacterium]|nr:phosphatase PAP2 family protein [Clostridiales bacterium]